MFSQICSPTPKFLLIEVIQQMISYLRIWETKVPVILHPVFQLLSGCYNTHIGQQLSAEFWLYANKYELTHRWACVGFALHSPLAFPTCCLPVVLQLRSSYWQWDVDYTDKTKVTIYSPRKFFGVGAVTVTGFSAETAGVLVIKGRASKNKLSWFCCHMSGLSLLG